MASPLHDNPKSKKEDEPVKKAAQEGDGGEDKTPVVTEPPKKPEPAAGEKPAEGEKPSTNGETPAGGTAEDPAAKFFDQLKAIHKEHDTERTSVYGNHETQRRDLHGSHRTAIREMNARHEKRLKAHMDTMAPAPEQAAAGDVAAVAPKE